MNEYAELIDCVRGEFKDIIKNETRFELPTERIQEMLLYKFEMAVSLGVMKMLEKLLKKGGLT